MKKDVFIDFYNNLMQSQRVHNDGFFSNETIDKVARTHDFDNHEFYRLMSQEEEEVITSEAFYLLLFWIKVGELEYTAFEKFMSILVTYRGKLLRPIDEITIPGMIELMSIIDFKEHVIYSCIELYIKSPDMLKRQFHSVH